MVNIIKRATDVLDTKMPTSLGILRWQLPSISAILSVRNLLLFSTIISLFSENARAHYGVDLRLFYAVIAVNLACLANFWLEELKANKAMLWMYGYLLLSGCIGIARGTDRPISFLPQLLGIGVCSFYYYNLFRLVNRDFEDIFVWYVNASFALSVLALGIYFWRLTFDIYLVAVYSPMQEPSHFTSVVLPAFYYSAHRSLRLGESISRTLTLFVAIVFASSAVGYIGLALAMLLLFRRKMIILVGPVLAIPLLVGFYVTSPRFQERVDHMLTFAKTIDLREANDLSTFTLLSNGIVTYDSFQVHPLIGGGLGSYEISYQKYSGQLEAPETLELYIGTNSKDANSLFFRILAELGVVGLSIAIYFLWKCRVSGDSQRAFISSAILIYFILQLLREGHYFRPEMYFFVIGYYFLYRNRNHPLEINST